MSESGRKPHGSKGGSGERYTDSYHGRKPSSGRPTGSSSAHKEQYSSKDPRQRVRPSTDKFDRAKLSARELVQKEEERKRVEEEEKKKLEEEERKRAEEERKQAEDEKKRLAEEEERKKQEAIAAEAERVQQEELKLLNDYMSEVTERISSKAALLKGNTQSQSQRPDEAFFNRLDSSLKKNTAFVKKLRNLTDSQKESLSKDFENLNLTKYTSEAASALVDAKLKMSDVPCALHICSLLYQRYADFSGMLLEHWQKTFQLKKDNKAVNPSKLRVDLRFFAELISIGVLPERPGLYTLAAQLQWLVTSDKEAQHHLSIVTSFCRHCGDDYAGFVPRKLRVLSEKHNLPLPQSHALPPEKQKGCRGLMKDYYASLERRLWADLATLRHMEKQNRITLHSKGELSKERQEKYATRSSDFNKLLVNAQALSDLVDEEMPELPKEEQDKTCPDILDFTLNSDEFRYDGDTSLYEDEETRAFYESLLDLRSLLPQILYKDSKSAAVTGKEVETGASSEPTQTETELKLEDVEREIEAEGKEQELSPLVPESDTADPTGEEGETEESGGSSAPATKIMLDTFLTTLSHCVNREMIDKAAREFCMNLNTKGNRRKLARALFTVQRTRYDLLPFYSRLVATLHPCMPDVASELSGMLISDFKFHVRKKDQINIESKMKSSRFIGEMVKFKMVDPSDALSCVKMLLFDFSHHNIEMACALLETCGRFLYRTQDSHHRTKVYLDVMMKKKSALSLDTRYDTLIENAYYYCNPPTARVSVQQVLPPMQQYIYKVIFKDLSKFTTEKCLKQMRKLNWGDKTTKEFAILCLSHAHILKYGTIRCIASVLAGLAPYHEDVSVRVVDEVLEGLRLGMEMNLPTHNQRRIALAKYLAELYNYKLIDSTVIFKTLYSFITFGVNYQDDQVWSVLDPPEHLFRLRLVCTVLDTCGQYFDRGSSKKKLDYFLVFFQRYFWFKKGQPCWTEEFPFPMTVENMIKDTLDIVRPGLKLCASTEESCEGVEKLVGIFKTKIGPHIQNVTASGPVFVEEPSLPDQTERMTASSGLGSIAEEPTTDASQTGGSLSSSQQGPVSLSQHGHSSGISDDEDEDDDDDDVDASGESQEDGAGVRRGRNGLNEEGGVKKGVIVAMGDDSDFFLTHGKGPRLIECEEDEDFLASFDKMLADNIQARSNETVKVPQVELTLPLSLKSGPKKSAFDPNNPSGDGDSTKDAGGGPAGMCFSLMTRRSNKTVITALNVPVTQEFVSKYKEREEAEKQEREKMKRLVLDINERQEEEEMEMMLSSSNRMAPNMNRERKVKYKHPKGAPDADLIFGSSKGVTKR